MKIEVNIFHLKISTNNIYITFYIKINFKFKNLINYKLKLRYFYLKIFTNNFVILFKVSHFYKLILFYSIFIAFSSLIKKIIQKIYI